MKLRHPITAVLLLAACSPAQRPAGPNIVTITATDFAFAAPDTIPAGLTTFRMANHGQEPHQAVIAGAANKSFAELEAALLKPGPIAKWLTFPAGPGVVVGHDSSNATANVAPGNYLIACFIPSPDGKLHVQKGMFRRLVVTPAAAPSASPEPPADRTVTLADYTFDFSSPLARGTQTIRVDNAGPQLHEISIERLAPGKSVADWQRWAAAGMSGQPPSTPVGGFIGPDSGKTGWFTVTLEPGNYVLLCWVPDAKDGKPHILHGMVEGITVN